jgi:membrane-bound lytic murein transglycosylase D
MYYLALVESGFDPQAYSRSAAVGMWQFMASTAREAGLRVDWWIDERRDPIVSTDAAARFLAELQEQFGSLYLAAAAYNGGPGRVARGLTRFADDLEGTTGDDRFFALAEKDYLPSDTKNYVPQIIAAALIAKDPARYGVHARTLAPYAYDTARVAAATPLAAVARALHITVAQVMDLNPHVLRGVTPPGAPFVVRVPPGTGPSLAPALRALDDSDRTAFAHVTTHRNETLAAVAERAGVERRQLVAYNPSLRDVRATARLKAGLHLLVPSEAVLSGARSVPDPSIEIYGRARATAGAPTTHRVRRGETLGGLAVRYHSSVKELSRLNHLKKPVIYAGQEIVVRGGTESAARHNGVASGPRPAATTRASQPVKRSSKARASSRGKGASSKAHPANKGKATAKTSAADGSRRKGSPAKAAKARPHKKKAPKA